MITTARLLLRPFTMDDAPRVQELAGAPEVAQNTLLIPHPYPDGEAERWIGTHEEQRERGDIPFAIVSREQEALIGAIGLHVKRDHHHAELGYWIGVPYWCQGFATEAASAVVRYGFETVALNRIFAMHFARNPASGRVLQKIGMRHEGTLRRHLKKWDQYVDLEMYGMLREEWNGKSKDVGMLGC
jgi:ribosomal-protein-alanine N-acetyltransferase